MTAPNTTLTAAGHPLDFQIDYMKKNQINYYEVKEVDLSTVRTIDSEPIIVTGDTLSVLHKRVAEIVLNNKEMPGYL